jgi:hypothetical protein
LSGLLSGHSVLPQGKTPALQGGEASLDTKVKMAFHKPIACVKYLLTRALLAAAQIPDKIWFLYASNLT